MGKNKKVKRKRTKSKLTIAAMNNDMAAAQDTFLRSLSPRTRTHFFSSTHVTPERRAEIWERQADVGEDLVDRCAWATPDARLLNVFRHFGPVVEVGCGANAYWSRWMHAAGGVDVVALDANVAGGGRISGPSESHQRLDGTHTRGFAIRQGSPETLSRDDKLRKSGRTLFLCYPDEEDGPAANEEEGPMSMAAACLEHFSGSTIIHVGELYSDTLSLDQAPFGR